MLDTTLYLTVFITLFVIMDPPGVIPVFLSLVGRKSREDRNRAAWQAPAVSLAVISVFAIGVRRSSTTSTSAFRRCRAPADYSCFSSHSNC